MIIYKGWSIDHTANGWWVASRVVGGQLVTVRADTRAGVIILADKRDADPDRGDW